MNTGEQFKEICVSFRLEGFHDESWQDVFIQFDKSECEQIFDVLKKNPQAKFSDIPKPIYEDVLTSAENHALNEINIPGLNDGYGISVVLQEDMPEELMELFNETTISQSKSNSVVTITKGTACKPCNTSKQPVTAECTHMRCLAIRQPWASLIVTGIKDIECRNVMNPAPGPMLVAASGSKLKWNELPRFVQETYIKYQKQGVLPEYKDLPKSAIIGYVNIVKTTFGPVASVWGKGHDGIKYVLDNAHEFDTPILGKNKATPLFYNVDGIDENNLPAAHVAL